MPSMEPSVGLEAITLKSGPELIPRVGCLTEPPRCPKDILFKEVVFELRPALGASQRFRGLVVQQYFLCLWV